MSDALSEIARDQERGEHFETFLLKVKEYVENPNSDTLKIAIELAEVVDYMGRGNWSRKINLGNNAENCLQRLVSSDIAIKETEWVKLLGLSFHSYRFQELKALSPFTDKVVVFVDYGTGFVNIEGFELLNNMISKAIKRQGMRTYDCDKYLVVMSPIQINPDEVKAFWLRCGILGVKGPRKPK